MARPSEQLVESLVVEYLPDSNGREGGMLMNLHYQKPLPLNVY
jgi:hypothetical protein